MTSYYRDTIPTVGGATRQRQPVQPADQNDVRRPRPQGTTSPMPGAPNLPTGPGSPALPGVPAGPQPGGVTPVAPALPPAIPTTGGMITNTGPGGPDPNPTGPVPPPPPINPNVPGSTITPYGPGGDLRGAMVTPGVTDRAGSASGMVDSAIRAVGTGASRSQIAEDRLKAFDLVNEQKVKDLQRASIQRASMGGRLGMGDEMVNSLRPFTDYQTARAALSHQLAADTAEGEIGDRFRGYDAAADYESGVRGFERGERDEVRGERDFQSDMARDALENAFRERQLESGEFSDEYNRALQEYLLELGVDPTAAFLGASNQYGQSAATSVGGASGILGDILARQGR